MMVSMFLQPFSNTLMGVECQDYCEGFATKDLLNEMEKNFHYVNCFCCVEHNGSKSLKKSHFTTMNALINVK